MIYGYSIYKIKVIGHGEFYWDEYYETQKYIHIKSKLFSSKDKRDQEISKEEKKYEKTKRILDDDILILPFETEINNLIL